MTRDPLKERRLEMLDRMPQLCRISRGFFIAEKKAALPWDDVATKLKESYTSGLAKGGNYLEWYGIGIANNPHSNSTRPC